MYGVGQMLAVLLTGTTIAATAAASWSYPADPDVPSVAATLRPFVAELEELVKLLIAADPKRRPSAAETRRRLQQLLDHHQRALNEAAREQRQDVLCSVCSCSTTRDKVVMCSGELKHMYCFGNAGADNGATCLASLFSDWCQTDLKTLAGRNEKERVICRLPGCAGVLHRDALWPVLNQKLRTTYEATQRRVAEHVMTQEHCLSADPVQRAIQFIDEHFLTQRCPNPKCRILCAVNFEQCLALKCDQGCGTHFCGWCNKIFPDSRAAHQCPCFARPDRPMWASTPRQQQAYRQTRLNAVRIAIEQFLASQKDTVAAEVRLRVGL
jgi:hypothetical protein